jgi:ABC-type multidrug transport system fused ATPase/permease subunit
MISIARTLLTNAEIIVLDDITTSLDPDSAKVVPKIINKLKKDHTIIMITKKPDLMKEADRILVLDHGKIVDSGTHKQLLKRNEIYQMLQARKSPSLLGVFDNSELEKREDIEEIEE